MTNEKRIVVFNLNTEHGFVRANDAVKNKLEELIAKNLERAIGMTCREFAEALLQEDRYQETLATAFNDALEAAYNPNMPEAVLVRTRDEALQKLAVIGIHMSNIRDALNNLDIKGSSGDLLMFFDALKGVEANLCK